MKFAYKSAIALACVVSGGATCSAETLQTHRIPAALAAEAVVRRSRRVQRRLRETAVVLDADGATIAALRGDGAEYIRSIARTTRRTPAHRSRGTRSHWQRQRNRGALKAAAVLFSAAVLS